MVSKSMLYKKLYKNVDESPIPDINVEQIRQILSEIQRLPPSGTNELRKFPVNFRIEQEGARKDIEFRYKHMTPEIGTSKNGEPIISGWKDTGRITSVDIISFFTKIKNNSSEHRIYQIGHRYSGEDDNF